MKNALITGVTGQDGSYLSEFLLEKGYEVHGIIRRSSVDFRERIAHLEGKPHFHLHYADLGDSMSIVKVVDKVRPDEIYNLAAQSHVQVSFDSPEFTADVDATGVLRVLEAVRACHLEKTCRIYQASTSELYGKVEEVPQNENTPFHPYSPYAVAKLYGFWIVKEYREAYQMFCCSGILFNHESERRGETFVTRKITLAAARISQGLQQCLYLGNLDSLRDWGYARDYVECMWLILQNDRPEDFVIATGVQHSVREFTQLAFRHAGIELEFRGQGINEKGICVKGPEKLIGKTLVAVSEDFYRPTDVVNLWGDPTKAKTELGWNPGEFRSHISYSWCDARFVKFNDGNNDYSGNRIPYVPEHTLSLSVGYSFNIGGKTLDLDATLHGAGPFNWNESGTRTEPFRLRADNRIALVSDKWELYVRAENLTDADGRSFYFKSVGNEFFASFKPRIIMTGITLKL